MQTTRFDFQKFNTMIRTYNASGALGVMPEVSSLENFIEKYPPSRKQDLREISHKLLINGGLSGSYIIASSGTTSEPLILGHKIWEEVSEETYPFQFVDYLMPHVLCQEDVVANLFTPGGLGVLYEGTCRILESTGATILPIGQLDSIKSEFNYLGLNTIMGTPSSVVQFAQAAVEKGIVFDIKKIIYTGEPFFSRKKEFIKEIWPNAGYYSMFGAVECGFVAINTPEMAEGHHEVQEDWHFIEIDNSQGVLQISHDGGQKICQKSLLSPGGQGE